MLNFKDQLAKDVQNVFMNPLEFAEMHEVTTATPNRGVLKRMLPMIIEKFTLDGKPVQHADGVSVHNVVVHISPDVLAYTPRVDQAFVLDGATYDVKGISNDTGIFKIVLQANGAG
ncbi:hypothetical protein J41TS12_39290 [Paenibacillus antibioticophila]|uniref:Uncharacterized protein n=1 Tax=Paenibacillus antibioticophila TaxID=1274374 RepID=A0A919XWR8_9BACL|nr:hypothetical protein [Paenibacillus antibioticophila]GIO39068.1 hypothetical protein J41TS12_39290 [Paenibacillus antibioticophila]